MRLEQLAVLIEVAKYKSLNLACASLHMTQQTLSACIKNMERELNVILLKRTSKGVSLTAEGKKVFAYAVKIIPEYEELLESIAAKDNNGRSFYGELRIYVNSLFYLATLTEIIKNFCYRYPEIKVVTLGASPAVIRERLLEPEEEGVYRVGLVNVPCAEENGGDSGFMSFDGLNFIPLEKGNYHACVSENSHLAKRRELSLRSILREPLVIGAAEELNVTPLHFMLSRYGKPNIVLATTSLTLWHNIIASNMGIGFLHDSFLDGREPFCSCLEHIVPIRIKDKFSAVTGCLMVGKSEGIIEKFVTFLPKGKV